MFRPRRRGGHAAAACALALLAAGGESDEALDPQIRAPDLGTYAYEAVVQTRDTLGPTAFAGTLVIDVSSEDSIVGSWAVDGYGAEARGVWNITAYTLPANPAPPMQGTITHRVWRRSASSDLDCALTYQHIRMPADTFRSSSENDCTLVRTGD